MTDQNNTTNSTWISLDNLKPEWSFLMNTQKKESIVNGTTLDWLQLETKFSMASNKPTTEKDEKKTTTGFWAYYNAALGNKKRRESLKAMNIPGALLLITLSILIWAVFFFLTYISLTVANREAGSESIIQYYDSTFRWVDSITAYPGISALEQETDTPIITDSTFTNIISSSLPFYFKRDIMEQVVSRLIQRLISESEQLATIQKDISKYGFLDPQIMSLLNTDEEIIPIITSLHTVETVKFWTALKMFSLLDTFLSQTSRLLWISKDDLESKMKLYSSRWEKDIARFLSNCYLNPYETLPECNQIGDFSNYFLYDEKNTTIDPKLLSQILVIIDNKLEQSDLPSLQINFDRFAPNAKSLWFRIIVNTLPEDEAAFFARGIINPHIFIISNLVNLLKQSLFIIGDSINVNKLNIQRKDLNIGNLVIPVSTSSMNFTLPLQNSSEREIYDFYENIADIELTGSLDLTWSSILSWWLILTWSL